MEEKKHFIRPTTNKPPSLVNLTFLAIFFGFIAGFIAYVFARGILPITEIDYLNLNNLNNNMKIRITQPLIDKVTEHEGSVAGVYKIKNTIKTIGQPLFSINDYLGSAVVVTTDGWLMTTDQVLNNNEGVIVLGDKYYLVIDFIKDEFTSLVFIKIDAKLSKPINFQITEDIRRGERLIGLIDSPNSREHSFFTTIISENHYVLNKYLNTDSLDYYLKLLDNNNNLASPYFNFKGNLLGINYLINNENVLIPSEYIQQAIKHLLNNTVRPELGLWYLDLENNAGFIKKGNLVYHPTFKAVKANSVASKAGLKYLDQIVSVNNDIINNNNTLTSIIQKYRKGDIIILKISRNGIEQDIEITL